MNSTTTQKANKTRYGSVHPVIQRNKQASRQALRQADKQASRQALRHADEHLDIQRGVENLPAGTRQSRGGNKT